jgi:hypothetical protein
MLEDRLGFEMLFDRNNTLVSEMIDMIFATMVTSLEVDFFLYLSRPCSGKQF